jgi:hypothetical protein
MLPTLFGISRILSERYALVTRLQEPEICSPLPVLPCFSHRLGAMTAVAPSPQVVEIKPQVRPQLDRNLMVGMQVPVAASECPAQLFQHLLGGWRSQFGFPEKPDQFRLPTTILTLPLVTLEAQKAQPAMVHIVPASSAIAAIAVVFLLLRATMSVAAPVLNQFRTARVGTGT